MKKRGVCLSIAVTVLALAASAIAGTPSYSYLTIDPPFGQPGVDFEMQIAWINDGGVISVQFQSPQSPMGLDNMHTAMLRDGVWSLIDVPGASSTGGTNPNNRGQIVLTYKFDDGVWHA